MPISSSTLFHFTNKLDTLKSILKDKSFWAKYCVEHGWNIQIAIPMTCFCDIPLSQTKEHIDRYGSYGLGLSKEWAINKGVAPVFYSTSHTISMLSFVTRGNDISRQEKIRTLMSRIKPCFGKNKGKDNQQEEDYNYYNEREWRFVPNLEDKKKQCIKVTDNMVLEELSEETEKDEYRLSFEYSDIKYLFVATEDDRLALLKFIDEIEKDDNQKILLKSKIMTEEQIRNDL